MKQKVKTFVMQHIQEHLPIYTFITGLFLMGVVFGAVVVNSLSYESKNDLYNYLTHFFHELADGTIAEPRTMMRESLMNYMQYLGFIWILGLSIIGLPLIFILVFLKGIVLGFTVGFLVNQMGFHGFIVSLAGVFPQNLLIIPIYIVTGTVAVAFSLKMFRQLLMKTKKQPLFPQFIKYGLYMLAVIGLLFIVSCYEAYLSPSIIRLFAH